MKKISLRFIACVLSVCMMGLPFTATAGLIGMDEVVAQQLSTERAKVSEFLARAGNGRSPHLRLVARVAVVGHGQAIAVGGIHRYHLGFRRRMQPPAAAIAPTRRRNIPKTPRPAAATRP